MGECGWFDESNFGDGGADVRWHFRPNDVLETVGRSSIRGLLTAIRSNIVDESDRRPVVALGHGDPSGFECFRAAKEAEDAVVAALRSGRFNSYAPNVGLQSARR